MEKRDAIFLLLVLGGGGYATYTHWDTIAAKLGLAELDPGRIKAIELTKKSTNLQGGVTNWQYLQSQHDLGKIKVEGDPWQANPISGQDYRVIVRWTNDGEWVAHRFTVNVATRIVVDEGQVAEASPPR